MKKDDKIPEFKTLEEERAYWEARGPLDDGHRGRINRPDPEHKLTSFLAVRLTGKEIGKLHDLAAKQGLGVSTYARLLLTRAINEQAKPDNDTLSEIKDMVESLLERMPPLVQTKSREKRGRDEA